MMVLEKNALRKLLLAGYLAGAKGVPQEDFLELIEVSIA